MQDMLVEYTRFGGPPEYVINAIKGKLNASLRKHYSPPYVFFASSADLINRLFTAFYVPIFHSILKQNLGNVLGEFQGGSSAGFPDHDPKKVNFELT